MSGGTGTATAVEGETVYVSAEEARSFVAAVTAAEGVPQSDAATIADCLVRADLRGVDTHGIVRLPGYIDRLRRGLVNAAPDLQPRRITPVAAQLDGQDGFGFVVATRAMAEALDMAAGYGLGLTSVKRSTHFGMAANYLLQAVEAGYIGFVFTNASRAMPPWGGREALLGTSPFAVGVPGGDAESFILDMAPSVAARGKIRKALRRGEKIPPDYALDEHGRPTTDPAEALKGVVQPMGGPKGSGLSMLMDILGGVISGSAFAGDVTDQYKNYERPQNVGHFLMAIKPDLFLDLDEFRQRMDVLVDRVHNCPRAEGFDEILIPGEPEARQEAARLRTGIPYSRSDLEPLQAAAAEYGMAGLRVAEGPLAA